MTKIPVFVIDENFPEPIVLNEWVKDWVPDIRIVSWKAASGDLANLPDNELILGLWQRQYEGLITCNHRMLNFPSVLSAIKQLRFSVVACVSLGDHPVEAAGLCLYHLPTIAKDYLPHRPQIWWLSHPRVPPSFEKRARVVEDHWNTTLDSYRFTERQLQTLVRPPVRRGGRDSGPH